MPGERAGHALISGGSSGIGLALAHRLAEAGWDLTLIARDRPRLAAARAAVAPHGRAVDSLSADVADEAAVAAAVVAASARLGPPGLVVACAGIVVPGCFDEQAPDAFRHSMEVNYLGALHLVRAALPAMRPRGGHIVLVASGAALIGLYGHTSYAPSKFAVRGLAEALRSEFSGGNIGVSVVYPPDTDTPGFREERRTRPAIASRLAGTGGLMTAEQVADAIMRGIARRHAVITPGASMTVLRWLHSLIGPALHRFWFDPLIARAERRQERSAASVDQPSGRPDDAGMAESRGEGAMSTTVKDMLAAANATVPRVSREDADALMRGGALVVDVRDAPELQAVGKVKGAKHVSRGMLEFRADPASPYHDPDFSPDRTVIVYCASGGRSALAGKALQDLGYRDVRNLGGFKDWAEGGGAVEPA